MQVECVLSLSLLLFAHSIHTVCSCHFRINNETVVFLAFVICTLHTRYIDLQQNVELWNECFMKNNANSEFRVLNMRYTERRLLSFCFLATQSDKSLWYRVVSVEVSLSNAHSILKSILPASAAPAPPIHSIPVWSIRMFYPFVIFRNQWMFSYCLCYCSTLYAYALDNTVDTTMIVATM